MADVTTAITRQAQSIPLIGTHGLYRGPSPKNLLIWSEAITLPATGAGDNQVLQYNATIPDPWKALFRSFAVSADGTFAWVGSFNTVSSLGPGFGVNVRGAIPFTDLSSNVDFRSGVIAEPPTMFLEQNFQVTVRNPTANTAAQLVQMYLELGAYTRDQLEFMGPHYRERIL